MNYRPFVPLAAALLILFGAMGLYGIGYYLLTRSSTTAAQLASEAAAKSAELERASRAHVALSTLESDESNLNQYAVAKADVVPFLESLQGAGKPFGASMNVISVSDQKDGTHSRIALVLTITGSFDAVMRTLGVIEYGPYDAVITNLSLETSGPDAKTGIAPWTATVTYSVGLRAASSTPSKP